jgi:hypothetical protein
MADDVSLEFLQRQQLQVLEEMRALREDLGKSLRLLTDTQISIGRTLSALDRRLSDVKDELETTIKMELVGHRNVTEDALDRRTEAKRSHADDDRLFRSALSAA